MRPTDPVYTVEGTKLITTAKAVQFVVRIVAGEVLAAPKTEWFPFSQVTKMLYNSQNDNDELVVSEWILKQKGLME